MVYATGINDQGWITVQMDNRVKAGLLVPGGSDFPPTQLLILNYATGPGSEDFLSLAREKCRSLL